MTLVALYKNSPAPRLLYRLYMGCVRLRAPITLGVRTLIVDDAERVLLVRHSYRPGWYFPGGGVKRWETPADAARREAREEAGVDPIRLDGPIGLYANFGEGKSDHVVLYRVASWRTVATSSPEIAEIRFFPLTDLPPDATESTRRRIDEHLGRREPTDRW